MVGTAPAGAQLLSTPMGAHPGLTQEILATPQALSVHVLLDSARTVDTLWDFCHVHIPPALGLSFMPALSKLGYPDGPMQSREKLAFQ